MRFLIDANLPRAVIAVFQTHGHDTVFARDVGLSAATDEQLAAQARAWVRVGYSGSRLR